MIQFPKHGFQCNSASNLWLENGRQLKFGLIQTNEQLTQVVTYIAKVAFLLTNVITLPNWTITKNGRTNGGHNILLLLPAILDTCLLIVSLSRSFGAQVASEF